MTIKAIAKGLLTYVVPSSFYSSSTGGTTSARYCYSVFLRHLISLDAAKSRPRLGQVAELGPGDSLGTGLAALIAGADQYFAFDTRPFARPQSNLNIFDELVDLFCARSPIPGVLEIPEVKPAISIENFPTQILTEEHLAKALHPLRLERLRRAVQKPGTDSPLRYVAPWFDASLIEESTIDWIFSQAVMEHVDDLSFVYAVCKKWLRPGGVMSHQIDFRSHGTAATWDGHRSYSYLTWRLIRGARPYLINREALSTHMRMLDALEFKLLDRKVTRTRPTLQPGHLARPFSSWTNEDLEVSGAFIACRKPDALSQI